MKIHKNKSSAQRQIMDKKVRTWKKVRKMKVPPSGWLKAIRKSLGMSTTQLAKAIGVQHSSILRLEKREAQGKASIESLRKAARAMNCTLVYSIVPQIGFENLEDIINERAIALAHDLMKNAEHTMRLEAQGLSKRDIKVQTFQLANELKSKRDSRLWKKIKLRTNR